MGKSRATGHSLDQGHHGGLGVAHGSPQLPQPLAAGLEALGLWQAPVGSGHTREACGGKAGLEQGSHPAGAPRTPHRAALPAGLTPPPACLAQGKPALGQHLQLLGCWAGGVWAGPALQTWASAVPAWVGAPRVPLAVEPLPNQDQPWPLEHLTGPDAVGPARQMGVGQAGEGPHKGSLCDVRTRGWASWA